LVIVVAPVFEKKSLKGIVPLFPFDVVLGIYDDDNTSYSEDDDEIKREIHISSFVPRKLINKQQYVVTM